MHAEEFRAKYELLKCIAEKGVRTYDARDSAGGHCWVHWLGSGFNDDSRSRLDLLASMSPAHRAQVRETLEVDGEQVVVTLPLANFHTFDQWLTSGVGRKGEQSPTAGKPGEFTALFGSPVAEPRIIEAPGPPSTESNYPQSDPHPVADQPPATPAQPDISTSEKSQEPGDFTKLFHPGAKASVEQSADREEQPTPASEPEAVAAQDLPRPVENADVEPPRKKPSIRWGDEKSPADTAPRKDLNIRWAKNTPPSTDSAHPATPVEPARPPQDKAAPQAQSLPNRDHPDSAQDYREALDARGPRQLQSEEQNRGGNDGAESPPGEFTRMFPPEKGRLRTSPANITPLTNGPNPAPNAQSDPTSADSAASDYQQALTPQSTKPRAEGASPPSSMTPPSPAPAGKNGPGEYTRIVDGVHVESPNTDPARGDPDRADAPISSTAAQTRVLVFALAIITIVALALILIVVVT